MGVWLTYRGMMTPGFVPRRRERMKLIGSRPYIAVIPWSLAAQSTDSFFTVAPGWFKVWGATASSIQPQGAEVLLYDPLRKRPLSDGPLFQGSQAGTGEEPFFFKRPYLFEPGQRILVKVANLSTVANSGRLNLCGFVLPGRPDPKDIPPITSLGLGDGQPATSPEGYRMVQRPPWIEMPSSGEPFNLSGTIRMPALGVTATIVSIVAGVGRSGVINRLANQVIGGGWTDGDGNLVFQITRNGIPERDQQDLLSSLGEVIEPSPFGPLRMTENDVIALTVFNNNVPPAIGVPPAGQLVKGRLDGWFYPKDLDPPTRFL
ncbi:MAG TPA: hypothetical protein VGR84_19195 [Candidatus Acidoferrales bacterium]|nr:hypothetical protein [Candidatus Acidoferrales bacterium]